MLPTWLAVATMLNAPAAQIAIVIVTAMSECRDARVTAMQEADRQRSEYLDAQELDTEVSAPAVRATSTPVVSANCNCLTKEYLEDGSVVFKDLCTKEAAMATPAELKAQAHGAAPQVR
jgi:hypothetical protein